VSFDNSAGDRYYIGQYSISSADTWEYKTVTIPGDTSGTWLTNNGRGINVRWWLGADTGQEGTVDSWQTGAKYTFSGAVSVIGTLNATWYITGVQLEVGSVATPFERRPFGAELALCQRYYCELGRQIFGRAESGTVTTMVGAFPVQLRATPTVNVIDGSGAIAVPGLTASTVSSILANDSNNNGMSLGIQTSGSTMSTGAPTVGNKNRIFGFSAEL
jgi:hypothetical protein